MQKAREFTEGIIFELKDRNYSVYSDNNYNGIDGRVRGNNGRKPDLIAMVDNQRILIEVKSPEEYVSANWFRSPTNDAFPEVREYCKEHALKVGKGVASWMVIIAGQLKDYVRGADYLKIDKKNLYEFYGTIIPALAFPASLEDEVGKAIKEVGINTDFLYRYGHASIFRFDKESILGINLRD